MLGIEALKSAEATDYYLKYENKWLNWVEGKNLRDWSIPWSLYMNIEGIKSNGRGSGLERVEETQRC